MAKMTFKLPEETIRKMEALGSHYDAVTSAVLEEGVKPLYDAAKQSLSVSHPSDLHQNSSFRTLYSKNFSIFVNSSKSAFSLFSYK